VLTNNQTIQGSGNIGDGQMTLVNSATGIIDANNGSGSAPLIIQTSGGTTNTGTLEATNSSVLQITGASGGNVTNTGGLIQATGNGLVQLTGGVVITGGTLTTNTGGSIQGTGTATLSGVTLSSGSSYQVDNTTTTIVNGTITNNGTITLAAAGNNNPTELQLSANTTLNGTGRVTMTASGGSGTDLIFGAAGSDVLTNNQTIQGSGNIGDGQMTLVNSATGIIDANNGSGSAPLIIQTSGGTTNTGILEATNSSALVLNGASGGNFTNTNGTIEALGNGAAVELENGVTITNGTLTSTGTGVIESLNSAKLSGVTLSTGSNYLVANTTNTTLVSKLTNNGTFTLDAVGNNSPTELLISGNVNLSGRGAVVMTNSANNLILGVASTAVLTNNSTIEGSGNIGDNFMGLVNGRTGVINANNGAGSNTLFIDVDNKNFNNQGTLIVGSGSVMTIEGSGSFLNMNTGTSTLTGGTYNVTGTLNFAAGSNGILTDAANITLSGTSAEIFNTTTSTNALTNLNSTAATGSFTINSGANFTTAGNFTNNGTLNVGSGSAFVVNLANSLTNFNSSTHTLTGGTYIDSGTLQFANANIQTIAANTSVTMSGASAKIEDQTGAAVGLTNLATNNGTFAIASGFNFTTAGNFTNNGTLNAGSGTKFEVNLADSLTNFNSGTSTLTGGTYIVGGTLQFANASIVTNNASITLSGATSKIVNQSNVDALATTFATNDPGATFALASGRNFTTPGNFTNNGTLSMGNGTKFEVNLADSLTNFNSGTSTLTGGTYNVTGTLQFNGANIVTNAANITLTGASSKILDQSNNNGLANFATNNGTFALAGNRSFTTAGNFANAGTFTINTGSTFTLGGSGIFTQSGGTTTDDGSLSASSGGVSLNGGSLFGKGSITGALTSSSAGTITPGDSSIATGILRDTGAYSQNSGTLDISIIGRMAGTQYDQLNPTTASLSGTLNIGRPTGFVPAIGNTFKIMNFTSETGTFATVTGLSINNTEHFTLTYQPTDVLLTVASGPVSRAQYHANHTIGKRAQAVINIRDSGELLSMLDRAVRGSDGRLTVSHRNRMNDTGKTDRINVDRMMRADGAMADIRRMRERGMINPRLGRGTRAF
jgi:fibronectin-binding autotransporter adhesin